MQSSSEDVLDSQGSPGENRVILGQIGKVHGIKGWLKLNSFTSPAENILDYPQLQTEIDHRWHSLEIDQCRQLTKGLLIHVKGYDDPESARALTGLELSVTTPQLPELNDGEYYWRQLEGLEVVNQHDEVFGRVSKLMETGANDVLVISPNECSMDDRERLIPYLLGSVIERVDLERGSIRVIWEADYLD